MIKVALTGGIGSGKSFIAGILESWNIPVFYADDQAKNLMKSDEGIKNQLLSWFGMEAFLEDGSLNTALIASEIFKNEEYRRQINGLVHSAVYTAFSNWIEQQTAEYVVMEAAIIFESGGYKKFDRTILVSAPKNLKQERLIRRGFSSTSEIESRMNAQWSDEQKAKLADYMIVNDEVEPLIPQIKKIHNELLILSQSV